MSTQVHFIVSSPRSGSTWLAHALNHHPQVFATEQRLFGRFADIRPSHDQRKTIRITSDEYARSMSGHYFHGALGMTAKEFVDQFQASLLDMLVQFAGKHSGKPVLVDKITPYPGTTDVVLNQIRKYAPQAQVIQLVRDGRDVATSGVFDWLDMNAQGTDRYSFFVERRSDFILNRLFDDPALRLWAADWADCNQALLDHPPAMQIRYERMKDDHVNELQKLCRVLEVDDSREVCQKCAEMTAFEKITGRPAGTEMPLQKARKGVVGDWKNYFTREDARLFDRLAGEQLRAFGYESSDAWISDLPEALELCQIEPAPNDGKGSER